MKFHIPTGLLTLLLCATNFATATVYQEDTKLGDLTDIDFISASGCHVEVDSINGGSGAVQVRCLATLHNGKKMPASFKVNGDLVLAGDSWFGGPSSSGSDDVTLIADQISTTGIGIVEFENSNVHALKGDITIKGIYYDKGDYSYSKVTNTELISEKGSVIFDCSEIYSGSISATNGNVDITHSTVTISGLSAQKVNINEDGVLNIEEAGRVELGEVAVGTGASLGIDGATLVFNEESTITLAEGATLTAFDNVSFEFIMDADSDGAYNFDVFSGIENVTDESSLALIEGFEEAIAAGEISITLKRMTAEGELIDLDASSATVSMENGMLSIRGTVTIPEPGTATLSLLALAGLAARRRRC